MFLIAMETLIQFFKALSDPNRLRIVNLLTRSGELCVCDIERVLQMPQARVSRHLGILRQAGIVTVRRKGLWMHYRMAAEGPSRVPGPLASAVFESIGASIHDLPEFRRDLDALCCTPDLRGTAPESESTDNARPDMQQRNSRSEDKGGSRRTPAS